ncbi:helix-turn-helix domain-containing protein [Crossiella sp. SN42]|nr:helix-turn-helix domain-containing protein [Crossiella sp. SN42]
MVDNRSQDPLWTPDELAEFLKVPEKTLRCWRSKQKGPAWRKIGKHVRYAPEDIRAWLAAIDSHACPENRDR